MSRGGANGVKAMLEALQTKVDLNSATIEALQAQREEDRNTIEDLRNALATQGAELEGEITRQVRASGVRVIGACCLRMTGVREGRLLSYTSMPVRMLHSYTSMPYTTPHTTMFFSRASFASILRCSVFPFANSLPRPRSCLSRTI
jgi:hypothetical protein